MIELIDGKKIIGKFEKDEFIRGEVLKEEEGTVYSHAQLRDKSRVSRVHAKGIQVSKKNFPLSEIIKIYYAKYDKKSNYSCSRFI